MTAQATTNLAAPVAAAIRWGTGLAAMTAACRVAAVASITAALQGL